MIVLGIDPGYALMGWGVVESEGSRMRLINYGCVETKAGVPMQTRLRTLQLNVRDLVQIYRPDDIAFEKLFFGRVLEKLPKAVRCLLTFLIASIGWGIFYFTDFSALGVYFGSLVGINNTGLFTPTSAAWCLGFLPTLTLAAVAATPLGALAAKKLERFRWFRPVRLAACVVLFVLCIASLASQSYNPFIYFRF